MLTIYELLDVEEDASKEEIEMAYSRLVFEFRQDAKFSAETNKENEMIINKLKIAYEILTNDEKRKKYDYQLAQKRAENLIEKVSVCQEESKESKNNILLENSRSESFETSKKESATNKPPKQIWKNADNNSEENELLSKDEKKEIRKAAEKEFKNNLKKVKQAEEEYRDAYNKAYNDYLRKNGYKVKQPWTLKRVKRLLIAILVIILVCLILWWVLPIKETLIRLYEENFVIKALVNVVKSIIGNLKI